MSVAPAAPGALGAFLEERLAVDVAKSRDARALLLDAHVPGEAGGTGRMFDWSRIPRGLPVPIILSGGLTPANVGRAVREVKPWAVDVSSGVESARGTKDPRKIVEFIRSVRIEDAATSR